MYQVCLSLFHRKLLLCLGLLLFDFFSVSSAQERYLHFTEIDGLPRNITTCLEQDQYGYLWVGTTNGISRYDGKNFYNYKELSGVGITNLLYDSRNSLWVASDRGLYKYNPLTNFFELILPGYVSKVLEDTGEIYFIMMSNLYKIDGKKILNIYQGQDISDFCFAKEGIWLGMSFDGVNLLSRESQFKKNTASYLQTKSVSAICKIEDKLYVGCFNGQLYSVNNDGRSEQANITNHYYIKKIVKVGQDIWLATDGNGIIIINNDLHFSKSLTRSKNTDASINSNSIYDIFPGSNQEIWLASYGAGITCILPDNLLFRNILPEKGNENSLVANEGVSVFVKNPVVYFGTNYGLSAWNANTDQYKNLSSDKLSRELKGTKVTAINVDENNTVWIGTYDGLLGKYNDEYNLLKTYHPRSNDMDEMQRIVLMYNVNNTNLLLVTHFQSRILLNFNKQKETTEAFELYNKGSNITYSLLNSIRKNQQGEILALISDKGLFNVNWKENVLENNLVEVNKQIDFFATDFYEDKKGNYWFTSSMDGLFCISEDGKSHKKYTIKEGLPSNTLVRIESVDDRFLWLSSISGLCRFDSQTGEVLNFSHTDGLPANEFLERASSKTDDGKIIFGSIAGFTIIDPSKVSPDTSKTEVIISDITFQNQSIRNPEGKQFLKQPLEETSELWLPYNKNSFSIHFFAKEKRFNKYHTYAFRLIGLEKNMNYVGETDRATYTNLSSGTYTFEIKSTDKTQESIPTRLIIHIQSPWYLSWYAYFFYVILFFTLVYLSVYAYLKRMQLKKEKEISEFKIQKEHELTEKKLEFFTNISHDLKTPLTLIDAPINDLLQSDNLNQEQVDKLALIRRNSKRLYSLITDLLDFRKLTQKQYRLEVKETDIYSIVEGIYIAFQEECRNKSVSLEIKIGKELKGFIDADKIEKILWNLLSNALKFTNAGGSIQLCAEELLINNSKLLKVVISDNGIGISDGDKKKIFDRFYKAQSHNPINKQGTGIGLSIVKELVEIHHGKIQVESSPGVGTFFTITLPVDKNYYSGKELSEFEDTHTENAAITENPENEVINIAKHKHYNLPTILIVEDNQELREYLVGHFDRNYKVYQAEDGFMGLLKAKEIGPDLILTDVRMPNMNGYEFCKEIRRNFDTSHIPVVMLTANDTVEQQIEGLSTGADSYISKPFDINLLDITLVSLLENRKKLRTKFLGIEPVEDSEKSLPQKDMDFIQNLKSFIENNMSDENLNIEMISSHFAISTAKLNRKIKSLLDITPNNLIKSIRLKKAYELLRNKDARVSEVAFQTGFSDPNYFTYCFKKEFGENPSQVE